MSMMMANDLSSGRVGSVVGDLAPEGQLSIYVIGLLTTVQVITNYVDYAWRIDDNYDEFLEISYLHFKH
jgi:hypothetical protein